MRFSLALLLTLALPSVAMAAAVPFTISSPNVDPGGAIDREVACDGKNVSPAIVWTEPPEGTKSLVLLVDDPDAPAHPFAHWVVYDIPPDARGAVRGRPPRGATEGKNSANKIGWTGPCPPSGTHHYEFTLYALDRTIGHKDASEADVRKAMQGHVIGQTQMTGTYAKGK